MQLSAGLYQAKESARAFLYRHGILSPAPLPCPVVSIGNLTPASGKTPFVEFLARHYYAAHALPSLILQRGRGTVDETLMLQYALEKIPSVVSGAATSTAEARQLLADNPQLRICLLDDGLQHLPLVRDLEIVMVSAPSPFGNGHVIPRGTLREPPKQALRRADAVILHHADLVAPQALDMILKKVGALTPRHALMMQTGMQPISLKSLLPGEAASLDMSEVKGMGEEVPLSKLNGAAVVLLAGVGAPQTVEAHLKKLGAAVVYGCGDHEDHHIFRVEEVAEAIQRVRELADSNDYPHACLVMTEKDYCRQSSLFEAFFGRMTGAEGTEWGAYVLQSRLSILEHDKRFSSQQAVLSMMLRTAVDSFRRRSWSDGP